jgi:hypothetical protein
VSFNDFSPTGAYGCGPLSSATCGIGETVSTWDVRTADT